MATDLNNNTSGNLISFDEAALQSISQRSLPLFEQGDLRSVLKEHSNVYDPKLRVLEFKDCLVNRNGFVKLKSGDIIADIGYREQLEKAIIELNSCSANGKSVQSIDEPVILVGGHYNYYHWHLNWLPRLGLADRFEDLRQFRPLMTREPKQFVRDSLEMLTGRDSAESVSLGGKVLHLSRVFIPVMFLNPMHAPFALRYYGPLRHLGSDVPPRKLYISRAKAPVRRVINDEEVASCLASYGYETVIAEDLPYREQVSLFSHASHIVGAHGAGLTNMLFSSPRFAVIELFNQYYTRVYWSLAVALGCVRYHGLSNDKIVPLQGERDQVQARKNADFIVDIERLRRQVEAIDDLGDSKN